MFHRKNEEYRRLGHHLGNGHGLRFMGQNRAWYARSGTLHLHGHFVCLDLKEHLSLLDIAAFVFDSANDGVFLHSQTRLGRD